MEKWHQIDLNCFDIINITLDFLKCCDLYRNLHFFMAFKVWKMKKKISYESYSVYRKGSKNSTNMIRTRMITLTNTDSKIIIS